MNNVVCIKESDLILSKKSRNYTHFMCPCCQNGEGGGSIKKNGKLLWYHESVFASCLDAQCGFVGKMDDQLKNNFNKNNFTKNTMEYVAPNVYTENAKKFKKGFGWIGETKTGKTMIKINLEIDDDFSDFRLDMEDKADNDKEKYNEVYVPNNNDEYAQANILFKEQPADRNRPCWNVMSDDIAMWNYGEPTLTEKALEEDEKNTGLKDARYRFSCGAFWKNSEDKKSDFYFGTIDIARVNKDGGRKIRPQKMILQVLKEESRDGNKPNCFIYRQNKELFDDSFVDKEDDEAPKEKPVVEKAVVETQKTQVVQKKEEPIKTMHTDEIKPEDLPF